MQILHPPDSHYVAAASGWLDLGSPKEALEELKEVTRQNSLHPDVLEILWRIQAKSGDWAVCLEIANAIIKLEPTRVVGWIHASRALHELKCTQEAYDRLEPLAQKFPEHWMIPYDLACYSSHLGRLAECQSWLCKAIEIDGKGVNSKAIADSNLNPSLSNLIVHNVMPSLQTAGKAGGGGWGGRC